MEKIALKNHSSLSQMRALERASERVNSWPEWKRSATLYRSAASNARDEPVLPQERQQNNSENRH
jgi:hypothetical protein